MPVSSSELKHKRPLIIDRHQHWPIQACVSCTIAARAVKRADFPSRPGYGPVLSYLQAAQLDTPLKIHPLLNIRTWDPKPYAKYLAWNCIEHPMFAAIWVDYDDTETAGQLAPCGGGADEGRNGSRSADSRRRPPLWRSYISGISRRGGASECATEWGSPGESRRRATLVADTRSEDVLFAIYDFFASPRERSGT